MIIREFVLDLLNREAITQSELARRMGVKFQGVNATLRENTKYDIRMSKFIKMMECIGYKVDVVKNAGYCRCSEEYAKKLESPKNGCKAWWYKDDDDKYQAVWFEDGRKCEQEFDGKDDCIEQLERFCTTGHV